MSLASPDSPVLLTSSKGSPTCLEKPHSLATLHSSKTTFAKTITDRPHRLNLSFRCEAQSFTAP